MTNSNRPTTKTGRQRQTAALSPEAARHADAMRASATVPADTVPEDIDVRRLVLARRMLTFMGMPRVCRESQCQRTRRCIGKTLRCQRDFPAPPMTEEEHRNAAADFRAALVRRMEEIERERAPSAQPSPAPRRASRRAARAAQARRARATAYRAGSR